MHAIVIFAIQHPTAHRLRALRSWWELKAGKTAATQRRAQAARQLAESVRSNFQEEMRERLRLAARAAAVVVVVQQGPMAPVELALAQAALQAA